MYVPVGLITEGGENLKVFATYGLAQTLFGIKLAIVVNKIKKRSSNNKGVSQYKGI